MRPIIGMTILGLAPLLLGHAGADEVSDAIALLKNDRASVRIDACHRLGKRAADPARAVPALVAALEDRDATVRRAAVMALESFGPDAAPATPALRMILKDAKNPSRLDALELLAFIGPAGKAALPEIRAILEEKGDDDLLRVLAARTHLRVDPDNREFLEEAINALIAKGLRHEDVHVCGYVCDLLGEIGAPAVDPLLEALNSPDAQVRRLAAHSLELMGPAASPAVAKLTESASDKDSQVRRFAVRALGAIGPKAGGATPAIVAALKDASPEVRASAASALSGVGADGEAAVNGLVDLVTDQNMQAQIAAIAALRVLDPTAQAAHRALLKALRDEDPSVQARAIEALALAGKTGVPGVIEELDGDEGRYSAALLIAELGPSAAAAAPALIRALGKQNDPHTTRELLLALAAIGPAASGAVDAIVPLLASDELPVRRSALYALGSIGPAAKTALPRIDDSADESDELLRMLVAWSKVRIDPTNERIVRQAMPTLTAGLADPVPLIRLEAAQALGTAGPLAKKAVPALLDRLGDDDPEVRHAVLMALAQIGPPDSAIDRIAKGLDDQVEPVRRATAFALGRAGASAKKSLPKLTEGIRDDDPMMRVICAWAIASIDATNEPATNRSLAILRAAANDPHELVRASARQALADLGKK